jgi:hypothetical protein
MVLIIIIQSLKRRKKYKVEVADKFKVLKAKSSKKTKMKSNRAQIIVAKLSKEML